jgi:hypothetical protein
MSTNNLIARVQTLAPEPGRFSRLLAPTAGAAVAVAPWSSVRSGFDPWSLPVILAPSSSADVPCLLAPGACVVLPLGLSMTRRRRFSSGPLRVRAGAHAQLQTADVTAAWVARRQGRELAGLPPCSASPRTVITPLRPLADPQPTSLQHIYPQPQSACRNRQ